MAPTIPYGTLITTPSLPAPLAEPSIGTVSPVSVRATIAEKASVPAHR